MPKMPGIKDVALVLSERKHWIGQGQECEVRLQVYDDGGWAVRTGDSSYDQDHRGYWGSSYLTRRTNCRELARDLIDECAEHAAQCQ